MPDDPRIDTGAGIHPAILERIERYAGECDGRHQRTNERINKVAEKAERIDRQTIACCGGNGGGRVAVLEKSQDDQEERLRIVEQLTTKNGVTIGLVSGMLSATAVLVVGYVLQLLGG